MSKKDKDVDELVGGERVAGSERMVGREREVALLAGQVRDPGKNSTTRVMTVAQASTDMSLVFAIHYPRFRERLASYTEPGVVMVAIDCARNRLVGVGFAAAKAGEPNVLIVGRHTQADLLLTADESVSLRHCALIVEPQGEDDGVRYRVVLLTAVSMLSTRKPPTGSRAVAGW
jgi:hypothetical protein